LAGFFRDGVKRGGNQSLHIDLGGGARRHLGVNKYHALSLINPDEKAETLALDLTLQPGRSLRGTVVGPDGKPLTGAKVVGLTALPQEELLESAFFTVAGLNPLRTRELLFYHKGKGLGKVVPIRGNETEPLGIQLDPCGFIFGRLVDKDGKPVAATTLAFSRHAETGNVTWAQTDRDGRFREALLPGQKYSLRCSGPRRLLKHVGEIEAKSGGSIDLGDLPVGD